MTVPAVGIGLHRDGRMATLLLSRPPLNILDLATLQQLERGLGALTRDPELDLLVVRGGGERAFSAGVSVQDHVGDRIGPALSAFHGADCAQALAKSSSAGPVSAPAAASAVPP